LWDSLPQAASKSSPAMKSLGSRFVRNISISLSQLLE
jgi:hypothetical protein